VGSIVPLNHGQASECPAVQSHMFWASR
jgi:hypothetical protein